MANGAYKDKRFRAIALDGIERHARWVLESSGHVASYMDMLADRPQYETKAEAAMQEAETTLTEALERVKAARERFSKIKQEG